jgi:hypothetical protein
MLGLRLWLSGVNRSADSTSTQAHSVAEERQRKNIVVKNTWLATEDIKAFEDGKEAAEQDRPRTPPSKYSTYNERAAFNDGWDSLTKLRLRKR